MLLNDLTTLFTKSSIECDLEMIKAICLVIVNHCSRKTHRSHRSYRLHLEQSLPPGITSAYISIQKVIRILEDFIHEQKWTLRNTRFKREWSRNISWMSFQIESVHLDVTQSSPQCKHLFFNFPHKNVMIQSHLQLVNSLVM